MITWRIKAFGYCYAPYMDIIQDCIMIDDTGYIMIDCIRYMSLSFETDSCYAGDIYNLEEDSDVADRWTSFRLAI